MHATNELFLVCIIPGVSLLVAFCLGLHEAITNSGHGMYNVKDDTEPTPKPQVIVRDGWV